MMKNKILVIMMLAALIAVPVFAATTDQTQPQSDWFNRMHNNHNQMMQQAIDNGTITADEAAQVNEHMQQIAPIMQKVMQNGNMMGNGESGCNFNKNK